MIPTKYMFSNKNILSVVVLSLLLLLISRCSDHGNKRLNSHCSEFSKSYASIVELASKQRDTLILIKGLNDIINKDGYCIDAYLTRGDLYMFKNFLNLAKRDYFKVLSLSNKNVYSLYQLGILYHLNNNEDSAIYFLKKALDVKTDGNIIIDYHTINKELSTENDKYDIPYNELVYQMAISYYFKRQMNKALENFNFCIKNNYKLSKVLLYRGAIYFEVGNNKLSCQDFTKAKDLGNSEADNYINKYCSK